MPTYLRLIILIGEVIGFLVFSIIMCRRSYREYKKGNYSKGALKFDFGYFALSSIIVIGMLFFSFPTLIFASYNKMLLLTSFIVFVILMTLGGSIIYDTNEVAGALIGIFSFILVISVLVIAIVFSAMSTQVITISSCIEEKQDTEVVYPVMNLTDKADIGYTEDDEGNITYSYYYQDKSGKWHFEDDFETEIVDIDVNSKPYLEKTITTKTFVNPEYKESSENYKTTEEKIKYVLYANEKHLIKIETD